MSTYDLPTEPDLVAKSCQAAYCARRRLGDVELSRHDMEDLIQIAALAYWKHLRAGQPVPYCFVAAATRPRSILVGTLGSLEVFHDQLEIAGVMRGYFPRNLIVRGCNRKADLPLHYAE